MSTEEWVVRFRLCDAHWAAAYEKVTDYTDLWDHIPWHPHLTVARHSDELSARDQYDTLRTWEQERSQPVKDVTLHHSTATEEQL